MALNKNVFKAENVVQQTNPYLADPKKGIELVSHIISAESKDNVRAYFQVDRLIDKELLSSTGALKLDGELELSVRLMALSERLSVPAKYRLLKRCTIIGVGGKFSSGKSAFLNTLIGSDANIQLPEEQTPSTAVPTYILHGSQENAYAYTVKGSQILLDGDAVEAISHAFQKEYGLGLAQYLSFLTVTTPDFIENVALLDTPGYNKPDSSLIESYSDETKAYSQLRSIDFLIWLIDVTNGTLTVDDIAFIRRLGISSKILLLVNKCDLKTPEAVAQVVHRTKADAEKAGLPLFAVAPYSSRDPLRYNGKQEIKKFLQYAQRSDSRVEDVDKSLNEISGLIIQTFERKKEVLSTTRKTIGSAVLRADNALSLKGMVAQYGQLSAELSILAQNKRNFQRIVKNIHGAMKKL